MQKKPKQKIEQAVGVVKVKVKVDRSMQGSGGPGSLHPPPPQSGGLAPAATPPENENAHEATSGDGSAKKGEPFRACLLCRDSHTACDGFVLPPFVFPSLSLSLSFFALSSSLSFFYSSVDHHLLVCYFFALQAEAVPAVRAAREGAAMPRRTGAQARPTPAAATGDRPARPLAATARRPRRCWWCWGCEAAAAPVPPAHRTPGAPAAATSTHTAPAGGWPGAVAPPPPPTTAPAAAPGAATDRLAAGRGTTIPPGRAAVAAPQLPPAAAAAIALDPATTATAQRCRRQRRSTAHNHHHHHCRQCIAIASCGQC